MWSQLYSQQQATMFLFHTAVLAIVTVGQTNAQTTCNTCVPVGQCYQTLPFDGAGQIDVRIVNPGPSLAATAQVPPAGILCTTGNEQCCTGAGITGCGVRYRIPPTPETAAEPGEAPYGSQPWMVSILTSVNVSYIGGGVLMNPTTVMTAAHKVATRATVPESITIRVGDWDSEENVEPYPPQESVVATVIIHSDYIHTAGNLYNDMAILKLATAIILAPVPNPAINTACPPTPTADLDGRRCFVSGWGKDAFTGTYQSTLKVVEVPIVADNVCQDNLRRTKLGPTFVLNTQSFLCAGGEAGKDACVGDGGSPLMCNIGGRFQVVGLVAWGIGCANASIPGVYVRVSTFLSFITENS